MAEQLTEGKKALEGEKTGAVDTLGAKPAEAAKEAEVPEPAEDTKLTEVSKTPDELYEELIASVHRYHPSADISLIEKAYHVASKAHEGQVRKSGEPYIIHPLSVAIILASLELDKETIAAGILHDVLEDTVMTDEEMKHEFGEEVFLLVDGVTKLQHLHLTDNTGRPEGQVSGAP